MTGWWKFLPWPTRLMIVLWLSVASTGVAEEIQLGAGPTNPTQAGFMVTVSTQRLGNEGFQPVTLRFRSVGQSFNRQRKLRVLFRPRDQYATNVDFQFACDVTLPQSAKIHDTHVLVPQLYRWESCSVHLIEDGRVLGKRPLQLAIPAAAKDWGQHISIGIITPRDAATSKQPWSRFPDVRGLVTTLGAGPIPSDADVVRQTEKQARDYVQQLQSGWVRFRLIDEDQLERSWLGYSQLDLILVPYPVLQRIATEQPAEHDALKRWVSAGAQIWTYGVSDPRPDWLSQTLPDGEVAKQFSTNTRSRLRLSEFNDESPVQYQPWNFGSYYSGAFNNSGTSRLTIYDKLRRAKHPLVNTLDRKTFLANVDAVTYGLGRVTLINADDPFPGTFQFWYGLNSGLDWSERNGVNYGSGNNSYWAWLMATVGMPPVTAFVVLNGLFVLVMGPLLYFTLRRRGRLYLLYFLAPALALLATTGLFLYAFVSDGFANRARIRQLTWFDGRQRTTSRGESGYPMIDQSRQTFYTVIDSEYGLHYDDETFVLPVFYAEVLNNYSYRMANHDRAGDYRIDRVEGGRRYSGEFLPTRTQVHHLATKPDVAAIPVSVKTVDGIVKLTSHLNTPLSKAGYRDADGKYWTAAEVPAGATVMMQPSFANPFPRLIEGVLEPSTSEMPKPFQARFNTQERSGLERRFGQWANNPEPGSFCGRTAIRDDRLPLRDCLLEDSERLIGGYLP